MRTHPWIALVALAAFLAARPARAFCGFYVSGADARLFNNATQVVLMRDGIRTVLSMANNYQGPPDDFAMVVPVPIVLAKENVKTLPREVFDRVDQLSAPRLVQYWEQDPCNHPRRHGGFARKSEMATAAMPASTSAAGARPAVRVEAEFAVGEYEIVILGADDSTALDAWLRQNNYRIPAGAEPVLRPYVATGFKFFVAKVNARKVRFANGMATLSPLRFHYDDDRFQLPVRLGLLNSSGTQDLIVHVLARRRYEVANYPNVTIPTNVELGEAALSSFGPFYAALFDKTVEKTPHAAVTEYAWSAGSCDPCPSPPLDPGDLATLGGDVMPGGFSPYQATLTRLHLRYTKDSLGQDLVFRAAPAIVGGNEWRGGGGDKHAAATTTGDQSSFQGRYVVRHPWKGEITCTDPELGRWGGRPGEVAAARDLAFAPRDTSLASLVAEDVPSIGVHGTAAPVARRFNVSLLAYLKSPSFAVLLGLAAGAGLVAALRRRARRPS